MEVDVQLDLRESREPRDIHNGFRRGPAGQLRPRLRDCASYNASGDRQKLSSLHDLGSRWQAPFQLCAPTGSGGDAVA